MAELPGDPPVGGSDGAGAEPAKAASDENLPIVEAPSLVESLSADAEVTPVASAAADAETEHEEFDVGAALAAMAATPAAAAEPAAAGPAGAGSAPSAKEAASTAAGSSADAAAMSRSLRFALLAASVGATAALGAFVGSLSAYGVGQLLAGGGSTPSAYVADSSASPVAKSSPADMSALKASLDGASRSANSQLAKLADRLDRLERGQIEPAVRLAHIADALDRLEKKGLVASSSSASSSAAAPETTGSLAVNPPSMPAEERLSGLPLPNWTVRGVRGGRALVENRFGGVFEVAPGAVLPGAGRVDAVKRQDGQWVVVTARGIITER